MFKAMLFVMMLILCGALVGCNKEDEGSFWSPPKNYTTLSDGLKAMTFDGSDGCYVFYLAGGKITLVKLGSCPM